MIEEVARRIAELIQYRNANCAEPPAVALWPIEDLARDADYGASVVRQALGLLMGQGRAVPVAVDGRVMWRRPTREERMGL